MRKKKALNDVSGEVEFIRVSKVADFEERIDRLERLVYAIGKDIAFNGNNAGVNPGEYFECEDDRGFEDVLLDLQSQIRGED